MRNVGRDQLSSTPREGEMKHRVLRPTGREYTPAPGCGRERSRESRSLEDLDYPLVRQQVLLERRIEGVERSRPKLPSPRRSELFDSGHRED